MNVYEVLAERPVIVSVVPEILCDPPPPPVYEDAPPDGAVNVTVAVVELVAVADRLVGGFGRVPAVPDVAAVPAVPVPLAPLYGVTVIVPYEVFGLSPE